MRRGWAGWAAAGGVAALMLAALAWSLVRAERSTPEQSGQAVPGITVAALDGSEVRLQDLRGMPVVLNFWASWCVPCRQEAPALNAAASAYAGRIRFLGVDIQDSDQPARAYQDQVRSPYPVGPAVRGSERDFGVTAPPETFFIDRAGVVSARVVGPLQARRLELAIEELRP